MEKGDKVGDTLGLRDGIARLSCHQTRIVRADDVPVVTKPRIGRLVS